MDKKAALELSVNAIVILIIAIAILGLILGFVKYQIDKLKNKFNAEEPQPPIPSSSQPITLSRETVGSNGKDPESFRISVYNKDVTEWVDAAPIVQCPSEANGNPSETILTTKVIASTIPAGSYTTFNAILTMGKVPKDTYACRVTMSHTLQDGTTDSLERQFTVTIS
jgi:hypothetical protein